MGEAKSTDSPVKETQAKNMHSLQGNRVPDPHMGLEEERKQKQT